MGATVKSVNKNGRTGAPNTMHVRDLTPDPENRRKHNPRNIGMVVDALQRVGAARSIVIDEAGMVMAGNGVLEAAAEAGIHDVHVVDTDGTTLVAVRRSGLTPEQKRDLAISDNRTAELAEWDAEQLAADLEAGLDLATWFAEEELASVLGQPPVRAGLTDPDAIPYERPTDIQIGDLFDLGTHRLLCGDSQDSANVARLLADKRPSCLVTDPPYGVDYSDVVESRTNQKKGGWKPISGDALDDAALERLVHDALVLVPAPTLFVWHSSNRVETFLRAIRTAGWVPSQQIVWVKNALVFGRADYQWRHEPCIYAKRDGAGRQEDRTETTVWEFDKPTGQDHPTSKPVGLYLRAYRNHARVQDAVYDPFSGSGTALIAAEQLTMRAYAVEVEPVYCQVAIDRWEAFTGQKAVKVGDAVRA